ncbi:hypothetical protein MMC25_005017 [Agyrium rufum]|nr:hypothetical protein [Agyrium rufum]
MKSYEEIDVDETPIVVLGCGHFFTAESLDGILGMSEVYEIDGYGEFIGLKDVVGTLAQLIPSCPDCKCPVRQFATQRYNRVINRAVIDDMSKRFLTTGRDELRELEQQVVTLERSLGTTREEIIRPIRQARTHLHDATVHAARKAAAATTIVDARLANTSITDAAPVLPRDRRVSMGGRMVQIKTEFFILDEKFIVDQALKSISAMSSNKIPGGAPGLLVVPFFQSCKSFIEECQVENLPKLVVEALLFYASISRSFESFCHSGEMSLEKAATHTAMASSFEESIRLMKKAWYEEVTAEEISAIKAAMVSGSQGIASHSGHWYNCKNGHPFAIGECGMPMELTRCPECGANVSGQNHTAVEGVTRAMKMEI